MVGGSKIENGLANYTRDDISLDSRREQTNHPPASEISTVPDLSKEGTASGERVEPRPTAHFDLEISLAHHGRCGQCGPMSITVKGFHRPNPFQSTYYAYRLTKGENGLKDVTERIQVRRSRVAYPHHGDGTYPIEHFSEQMGKCVCIAQTPEGHPTQFTYLNSSP